VVDDHSFLKTADKLVHVWEKSPKKRPLDAVPSTKTTERSCQYFGVEAVGETDAWQGQYQRVRYENVGFDLDTPLEAPPQLRDCSLEVPAGCGWTAHAD
jgi:hypothetical protein